jgi:hypothetical protein
MPMKLLFHIGCEKTGTTSTQVWMHQNANALAERGVVYSQVLGRPNNRRITFYGLDPGTPDDGLRRMGVHTAEQHAELQAQIAREAVAEIEAARAAGCTTFVISNEHCHSRLKTDQTVARVHDLLAPLFDEMHIYCLIRPQIEMAVSLTSTLSRNGGTTSRAWLEREVRANNPYYDFHDLLARWSRVFGRDNITAVPFARTADTVAYFERLLGVTEAHLPRRDPANTALDYRVIALINGMNAGEPTGREFDYVVRLFLNELPVGERLTLDLASAEALHARFEDCNAALCRDWPQIEIADVTPDWSKYPETGTVDRLDIAAEVGPFVRRILDRMRMENAMEKARRLAMTSEREMTRGRTDAALRACRDGITMAELAANIEAYRQPMEQIIARLEHRIRKIQSMPVEN